jgi:fido (protein-threonine AMPylation protein)
MSERLSAGILHLERYESVDPQHPLGGRDGGKDIVFAKEGERWIAACFFPPTEPSFAEVKTKFQADVKGVKANDGRGIAFFVNQHLTISERNELLTLSDGLRAEIYHVERIRGILDDPRGYGLRLEYLGITMRGEEQVAFFSALNYDVTRKLLDNDKRFNTLEGKVDLILKRTTELHRVEALPPSSLGVQPGDTPVGIEMPTATLSVGTICWIHRVVTESMQTPESARGRFRSVQVLITANGDPKEPFHRPPSPEDVVKLMREYVKWWTDLYPNLQVAEKSAVVEALAQLHHRFLLIHPFVDANGRVARVIVDQAARDLLNMKIGLELTTDKRLYFAALETADRGDIRPLAQLIAASLQ